MPIDISGEFLRESAAALAQRFPGLPVHPVEADFMHPIALPEAIGHAAPARLLPRIDDRQPDGTAPPSICCARWRGTLGVGAMLLIGMDRVKDEDVLVPAYDDAQGVTAAFNLNLLHRINRELDGDIPVRGLPPCRALERLRRRGSRCISRRRATWPSPSPAIASRSAAGETIHTENSHKYDRRGARLLLAAGGWTTIAEWTDPQDRFAMLLAEVKPPRTAP